MKQNLLIFIIGLFLLFSCKEKSKETDVDFLNEIEMDISNIKDSCYLSQFVESIEYIKLTLPSDYFFGIISNILFHNEDIFIIDRKQRRIFRFNKEGQFLNLIGSRGNGPEEFLSLSNVIEKDGYIGVCDLDSRKINFYNSAGEFVRRMYTPVIYRSIISISEEKFLCFTPDYDIDENYGLWTMNQMGEIEKKIYQPSFIYPTYFSYWNSFFRAKEDKIGVANLSLLEFYVFDAKTSELSPWLRIKPNSKILADFIGVNNPSKVKEKYTHCMEFLFSENYGLFLWSLSNVRFLKYSVYDIRNNSMTLYDEISCDLEGCNTLGIPVSSNLKNSFVSVITEDLPQQFFPDYFKEEDIDEGSVILQIFKMK